MFFSINREAVEMLLRHGANPDLEVDGSENLRDVIAANIDNFDFAAYADKVSNGEKHSNTVTLLMSNHSVARCLHLCVREGEELRRFVLDCILNFLGEENADKAEAVQLRRER